MSKRLFWKFFLVIVMGVVGLFWVVDLGTTLTEKGMSFIDVQDREQITAWGHQAERLYLKKNTQALDDWLKQLQENEDTWVAVAQTNLKHLAGAALIDSYYEGFNLGRNVDSQIHLYMEENPIMEVPFSNSQTSFLIQLPNRMRPGSNFEIAWLTLQIILPMILLVILSILLYRHIMVPLRQLDQATKSFTQGKFSIRVRQLLGKRNDELSDLAETFDTMAERIGEQIISQRQLIADISHELRTPLTRLDISVQNLKDGEDTEANLDRINWESRNIRKLVDDSLTLAWLENERPNLQQESLDLVDLLDVLVEDARFEFPDQNLDCLLLDTAKIENSNHRAIGQALENILRNAMRHTPLGKIVTVTLSKNANQYIIKIHDQGPGVNEKYLQAIFKPFFRIDSSRPASGDSFGLGLALAQRQLTAVGGQVSASNHDKGGLELEIALPLS